MQTIEQENEKLTRAGYPPLADCEPLHTPGPWSFEELNGALEIVDETGIGTIAQLQTLEGISGEDIANARLISSAPDLLSALEFLLSDYLAINGESLTYSSVPADKARAAISKAKGGAA
jgi:hypothetical protein